MARERIVYAPVDRPAVEVLVDGTWCFGVLRMWTPVGEDSWEADVTYWLPGETSGHIATFPANQVREDTVDRSRGRS